MEELSISELDKNTIPYRELQCILGVYFRPSILDHQSWRSIANEITDYCTPRCVQKIIRQLKTILNNPAINDFRLVSWIKRYAITWSYQKESEARILLRKLLINLEKAWEHHSRVHIPSFRSVSFA
jgi:hypothetical protein